MNRELYSNTEFTALKERLNQEIQRRGTYEWWDPLTTPSVGMDKSSPLSLPAEGERVFVNDKTYTVNNPSEGSIERTRNIFYDTQGENPSGQNPDPKSTVPNTSAAQMNTDEMRNFLVGLAKIHDINLFYGRDEIQNLAFRDPRGIEEVIEGAEASELHRLLADSALSATKEDPNGGIPDHLNPNYPDPVDVTYPVEDGAYVMPSGESDGEELKTHDGVGPYNFFDDYGAKPGDGNFHPYNRNTTEYVRRDHNDQDNNRNPIKTIVREGGIKSSSYGANPRNPNPGKPYKSRKVYGGVPGSCNVACTGMCFQTCDHECGESCTSTCWSRCGNACTASCGNVCTGCSSMCYQSCKTKCENTSGYACLKAGAKTVKIESTGGHDGEPAKNELTFDLHTCQGCSYSCQFYPNKKTECWDTGCMGKCFTSCSTSCSTSCFGGCIDNNSENSGSYKTGIGRGCSSGCTVNCIGICSGVCEGYCVQACWQACKQQCSDNCSWGCSTVCGNGCASGCSRGCTGCTSCAGSCIGQTNSYGRGCVGCGAMTGCTSNCQHDCNKNCIGWGCRSICGIDTAGSCEANCRLNCMGTSCTSMCSDVCSAKCSTCVNTCGFQCGTCSSMCSTGCESECNIDCSANCEQSCDLNCVHSCTEECGGCSNLCYSCVGMCIGVCSVKCEDGCSMCANMCGWWCDYSCNRKCFANCDSFCISTCSGSCSTFLKSESTMTVGPTRTPTAEGYIYKYPKNRWEERESFRLFREPGRPYIEKDDHEYIITIDFDDKKNLRISGPDGLRFDIKQTSINSGVFNVDHESGETTINVNMIPGLVNKNEVNLDGGGGIYIIVLYGDNTSYKDSDIQVIVPFGLTVAPYIHDGNNTIVIIQRDEFLMHGKTGDLNE